MIFTRKIFSDSKIKIKNFAKNILLFYYNLKLNKIKSQ